MNIFENFIPHETITVTTKISPGWINKLKHLLRIKNVLYKRLKKRMLIFKLFDKLDALQLNYKVQ